MDGVIIRRAQASDATDIASLSYPDKTLQRIVFGRGHVAALIETSYLALSAEDASGHVIAFLAVNDEPPSELAEDVDYFEYVAQNYTMETKDGHARHFSMHRSLFLSYFVQTAMDSTILSDILQTVYQLLTQIEWILFPIAKSVDLAELQGFLSIFQVATQLTSIQADDDTYSNFDLYASHMSNFVPTVAIRKANIEDHDDLEPILKAQNESLIDTFGEYFLAELIGSQTNHNTCLVAEDSDARAVGLMALSDEIDLTVLRESFDLTMYNNLLKSGEPRLPGSSSTSRLEKLLKRRTSPKMILLGPPSCGKTTQVEKLVATYGLVHLSTTVLARAASRRSTPIASKLKRILDRQEDIPNDIIIDLIAERIHDSDCVTQGWILDGHPQSESQAWDLIKRGIRPDVVLSMAVPDEVITARLEKAHSTPDIVDRTKSKLQSYHEQSTAILKCFSKEMALITIDGNSDRESVAASIIHALSSSEKTKSYQSVKSRRKKSFGPPKFIICGPPAGGKGTQCELLVQEYGVIHLSTGDMLRSAIQAGSEMGLKAKGYMDAGELVPDDLIVHVILERLTESDCETHGWLLDGFPRTQSQAEAMISEGIVPDLVIVLDVPDEEVVKRISGRRVDLDTGKTYHLTFNPPPPELKDKVVQRSDDTEEVIRVRLSTFHANCDAVVSSFDASSIILNVDGMKPKDDIIQEIIKAFPKKKTAKSASTAKSTGLGPPRLIICGPPAGGKGTQCELLVAQYGVVHLSTGDMLRASIQAGSEMGLKAKSFMEAGELVPDELIVQVILERLQQPDCITKGWLLDGFPRTKSQAQAMLAQGIFAHLVIVLDVPDEVVVTRISGRRIDIDTGKTYHLTFNPPPPELKDKVVQRADDTEETIRVRLTKYHENCGAVVDTFAGSAQILNVNGLENKEKIASDIFQAVNSITNPLRALPPKLIICGPPAGGKGTQCEKLVQQYGVVHLSTGDMLRSAIAANTETGLKAKAFMDRGELVPDELILDTIIDRLNQPDCTAKGWLLDGFPRNESQARSMVNFGIIPDMVLVLEVSDEEVVKRISGRRVDVSTGKTYHVTFNPPPPDVKVIQRSDDNESTVKIRLKTYHLNVSAVLKVFAPLANVSYFHQSSSSEITKAMFRAIDDSRAKIDVEGNAFIMTLFCMEMPYQTCASSFLRYAFSLYQHKEYCLITLPPTARPPTFVSSFTFAPARAMSTYSHVLYLLHRDALTFLDPSPSDMIRVTRFRMAEQCDQLGALVESLPPSSIADLENEMALAAEEDDIDIEDNPKHIIFVARLHGVVIALASLTRDHEVTSNLKHHFDIEQYVVLTHHRAKDQAILSHFLLNPVYTVAGQFIFKEVMRYFRKTCIFVSVPHLGHVSALVQESFILAPHRRQVVMKEATKEEQPPAVERLTSNALYFFTKRLFSEPKCIVSTRIVVVGASDTGLTVLKKLVSIPYIRFSSITLVSPNGLALYPAAQPPELAYFTRPSLYSAVDLEQAGLHTHIRIVTSRLVQLDRAAKAIILVDNSCLPYDVLVLTTGLSDGTLASLGIAPDYDGEHYFPPSIPNGVFALNDALGGKKMVEAVKSLKRSRKLPNSHIVVAGSKIFALSVIEGLLRLDIGGNQITWLNKCPVDDDIRVQQGLLTSLTAKGIKMVEIDKITALVGNQAIEGVEYKPLGEDTNVANLPCDLLVCCDQNDVDCDAFRAMNESGLVYDGRLVVNASFQTTDPSIYAGGSLCRFSRRYPSALFQQYYSSRECGEYLAASLLRLLDPVIQLPAIENIKLPKFNMPKLHHGICIDGIHFVRISLPDVPNSFKELTTESSNGSSYCSLHFDDYGVLCRLTYLGQEALEVSNFVCLVGLHEAYLNSAIASFQQNLVSDWVDFFRQKWAFGIYHDRFQDFCIKLNAASQYDEGIQLAIDQVQRQFEENNGDVKAAMTVAQTKAGRGGSALPPTTKKMIELHLMEYLSVNRDVLDMYFLPRKG